MSVSLFLDTLRKHELDQFYPAFSTHGITHLQGLAQLSLQDYSKFGITDTNDRKKIFGLVQTIRKETTEGSMKFNMTSSASMLTSSGLRQPQTYSNTSRLPQPDFNRGRRQSVIATSNSNTNSPSSIRSPHHQFMERPTRSRTLSDAPRPDLTLRSNHNNNNSIRDRKVELRRSLYFEPENSMILEKKNNSSDDESEDEEEETTKNRKYRASAPLLDAYGVPLSPSKAARQQRNMNYYLPQSDLNQKIRVCVRKRPLNRKELERGDKDIAPNLGTRSLQINEPKLRLDLSRYIEQHTFTFDDVFDSDCANNTVYERTALPLVKYIFKGGKATCFAYGQTGSGKTFTMLDPKHGLYVLAARDIFSILRQAENQHLTAWIGLYEIYQGHLFDLLNERKKLFAREDGKHNVIISGLKEYPIDNVDKLIQVFEYGSSVRSTGSTGANDSSSRSHAVLQILLKHKKNRKKIHGKLSFIDLAGSERGADRGESDTKTRMEGAEINKSLLALKECIRALDQAKIHTPFRQSKLTQVLKDSFVGNSRTCMIATISPGGSNSEHTLNTLRYADRVKELKGERERKNNQMERSPSGSGSVPEDNRSTSNNSTEVYEDDFDDDDDDDDDDDLLINGEDSCDDYFSNDSDFLGDDTFNEEDIFDVDFPHEQDALIHSNSFNQSLHKSSPYDSSPMHNKNNNMINTNQFHTNNNISINTTNLRPNSMSSATSSAGGMSAYNQRPNSLHLNKSTSTLPRSISMYSPRTVENSSDSSSSPRSSRHLVPASPTSFHTQPQQPSSNDLALLAGVPSFTFDQMDEFIKFHRAEIRENTECTKLETKLAANISLDITSNNNQLHFQKYLQDLDELLDRKLAAVEALRDRISDTVAQVEI